MRNKPRQYRLRGYNYGRSGAYFVTICTQGRMPHFGQVVDGQMRLSEIGVIATACWEAIPTHYPGMELDTWVLMPDHLHGILLLPTNENDSLARQIETSLPGLRPLRSGALGTIINRFKGSVKRLCNQHGYEEFAWQPRFHDHIIRDRAAHERIQRYIEQNPANWQPEPSWTQNLPV